MKTIFRYMQDGSKDKVFNTIVSTTLKSNPFKILMEHISNKT